MVDVTALIVKTLQHHWPDLPIYTEPMDDGGFKEPSIFVNRLGLSVDDDLFDYRRQGYSFELVYFPDPASYIHEDMDRMAEEMAARLKYINGETDTVKLAKVESREMSVVDSTLHFYFTLRVRTVDADNAAKYREQDLAAHDVKLKDEEDSDV